MVHTYNCFTAKNALAQLENAGVFESTGELVASRRGIARISVAEPTARGGRCRPRSLIQKACVHCLIQCSCSFKLEFSNN